MKEGQKEKKRNKTKGKRRTGHVPRGEDLKVLRERARVDDGAVARRVVAVPRAEDDVVPDRRVLEPRVLRAVRDAVSGLVEHDAAGRAVHLWGHKGR